MVHRIILHNTVLPLRNLHQKVKLNIRSWLAVVIVIHPYLRY